MKPKTITHITKCGNKVVWTEPTKKQRARLYLDLVDYYYSNEYLRCLTFLRNVMLSPRKKEDKKKYAAATKRINETNTKVERLGKTIREVLDGKVQP